LAYTFAQGVNTLAITPFLAIWDVTKFEVAGKPEATAVYSRVFDLFLSGLIVVMLGLSLFVRPLLHLLTTPAYWSAAEVVPVICLGYVFFSSNIFFTIPASTRDMTHRLVPANAAAALINTICNIALIPTFGIYGAAIATVIAFLVLAIINFAIARQIAVIPYPLTKVSGTLFCAALIYCSYRLSLTASFPMPVVYVVTSGAFLLFVATIVLRCGLNVPANLHFAIGRTGKRRSAIDGSDVSLIDGCRKETNYPMPRVNGVDAASAVTE
jgi:O-antigen/teichoic acid export membrane protein